jgi:nucleosome assembly protein 1-like 1
MAGGKKKPEPKPTKEESEEEEEEVDEEFDEDCEEEEEFDLVEAMNEMSIDCRRKIYALKALNADYEKLMGDFRKEVAALELEQLALRQADFERRRKIVSGEEDVTQEEADLCKKENEVAAGNKVEELPDDDEDDKKPRKGVKVQAPTDTQDDSKGIPKFWLTAMKHNEVLQDQITEKDEEILKYLTDVSSTFLNDNPMDGFVLHFHFAKNPFFSNTVLTKTCHWNQERKGEEEQIDKLEGTDIKWSSPEKNPCVTIKEKKQRHKSGKGVRVVKKEEKAESFFHFFSPIQLDEEGEPIGKFEEEEDVEQLISMDEDMTLVMHSSVVSRAAYFYSGEPLDKAAAMLREVLGLGGEDDEEDDEEFDDDDEEEEEEEEKPKAVKAPPKKGGAAKRPPGKGHADPNQECKPQ